MSYSGKIIKVNKNSLGEELGIKSGDLLLAVNGQKLIDIIDLSFALADEEIELLIEHTDGNQEIIAFDKDYDEELGVEFESAVFNGIRRCGNKCCFCFVDQVAPNMRSSLSVKDDDYRMSFLYGNFVTMTNMGIKDFERIQKLHLSPLYLSIHTTNPKLRISMMKSKRAGEILNQLDKLDAMDIKYHTQVVLCPGINDGSELDRTITDIDKHSDNALSIAIVPVGLTKYRDGCYPLQTFTKDTALTVIKQVEKWQNYFREKKGCTFVYLSDEFYLTADYPLPQSINYDGFPQLDNGIGLSRNFIDEWEKATQNYSPVKKYYKDQLHLTIVCGKSAEKVLSPLLNSFKIDNLYINTLAIINNFFGPAVTVTGLLTGQDILTALQKQENSCDGVILPSSALRTGENIFLDDYSLEELQKKYPHEIKVAADAKTLYELLTKWHNTKSIVKKDIYTWQSNAAYTK
ncbi:DUF512 domain-containing protein [Pectinatus sottacetonis]|uniref:DUF512 domain-containing protein n=2 Tax=Pectinatus sottacetonis TaxID=1002795 RepID=UPI0018C81A6D|nr:DUF512 domain-containing protein [Pectinatus sottacetonis]